MATPAGGSTRLCPGMLTWMSGERRAVWLGALAQRHPAYAELKSTAAVLAELTGANLGLLTEGANAAGAYLAGAVPHRLPGGHTDAAPGLPTGPMLLAALKAYVLLGGIDPETDLTAGAPALAAADCVVAITTHLPPSLAAVAHVVLPIGSFAETSGSFVNIEGRWQSWAGAAKPAGESRPGWKVLRVLGNLLQLPNFEYLSSEGVRDELRAACTGTSAADSVPRVSAGAPGGAAAKGDWLDVPPYQIDALVRGSDALARTKDGQMARVVI